MIDRRCVLCRRGATVEARRSMRVGWEPLCETCRVPVEAEGRSEIRSLGRNVELEKLARKAQISRYKRRWYKKHRMDAQKRARAYNRTHKASIGVQKKAYYAANREYILAQVRLRRSMKRALSLAEAA